MTNPRASLVLLLLCSLAWATRAAAQQSAPILEIEAKTDAYYSESNGVASVTNGVTVKYTDAYGLVILTADNATINQQTGDIFAQGAVQVRKENQTWLGDSLHYNFLTKELDGEKFRTGQAPFYVEGQSLHGVGEGTNSVYQGTNALITTDDYYRPLQKIRAKRFTLVPGKYIEAHDATFYVGNVPVFYFPYYRHLLTQDQNHFTFLPGYRSIFGPYLLTSYEWVYNDQLRGAVHLDYRESRGVGAGPDFNYNLGDFGAGALRYYYTRDQNPGTDPGTGAPIGQYRQRVYFSYGSNPATNLTVMSQVAFQSDPFITHDFFENEYKKDIQPNTFLDADKLWRNWSLDAIAQPRVNPYWETVERLPEARLTGFRQQIGDVPLYYESQSTLGYYRRRFSDTNSLSTGDFSASRADTFHQFTLPQNYFGWLNITPRVGGRFTYYNAASGAGATTTNESRGVFNTGAEASFTVSRLWAGVQNDFWDVDGLRHIFQPSLNYVFIPRPNVNPSQVPQFDYELTNSLRLLPIDFPDYNAIDSINSQNTIRFGMNNRLQTKRKGEVEDLVDWGVYMDWHLSPRSDQSTFSDIYSDLALKPRTWLTFDSFTRYSIAQGQFNLAQHTITLQPNNTWNWTVGHLYLRSGALFGVGDNLFTSLFFYRLNENWGTRVAHYFDADTGKLQEQDYTIYRDLRSWTAALTFRALNDVTRGSDYTVAFTFSFKSFPHYPLGGDTVRAAQLVGY